MTNCVSVCKSWSVVLTEIKARLNLMNKIIGGRVAIPLEEYITQGSTRPRSVNNDKFKLYAARTLSLAFNCLTFFKNSFFPRTIPVSVCGTKPQTQSFLTLIKTEVT